MGDFSKKKGKSNIGIFIYISNKYPHIRLTDFLFPLFILVVNFHQLMTSEVWTLLSFLQFRHMQHCKIIEVFLDLDLL